MNCNLNELSAKWKSILDTLLEEYHFEDFLIPRNAEAFHEWDDCYGYNCACKLNLSFHNGMTRLVITDDSCDCAIKIQFLAQDWEKYQYDYNKVEAAVYQKAIEEGLEEHFTWMYKLLDLNFTYSNIEYSCPIYAMEFCEVDDYYNEELSTDYQFKMYCDDNNCDEDTCTYSRDDFFDGSGEEDQMLELAGHLWDDPDDFSNFQCFLDDMGISDLHSGNWGFVDGRFVVCDYGGYCNSVAGIEPVLNPTFKSNI